MNEALLSVFHNEPASLVLLSVALFMGGWFVSRKVTASVPHVLAAPKLAPTGLPNGGVRRGRRLPVERLEAATAME